MSSSLKMPLFTLLLSFLCVDLSIAGYVLEDDYSPSNFFDMFSFFTDLDPTHGFVDYVDQSTAQSSGLIGTTASTIYIGTDHDNVTPNGRPSIRLTSNKAYNVGSLIILDLEHMPGGICGTWPAFWMVGPNWPSGGEIDIIEGVNEQSTNAMTLHTDSGCSITNNDNFTGSISTYNCDINASGQTSNAGCSIDSADTQTYGSGFNDIGGGVYATEWTNSSISVWFFPRSSIPADITAGTPTPSSWGEPTAQFQGGCDIPEFFQDNQLVFDLTYCGDWAGDVWGSSSCSSKADTCIDYVQNNPMAFTNAYWSINSLRAYQYSSTISYSTSSAVQSSTSTAVTISAGISLSIGVSPYSSVATSSTSTTEWSLQPASSSSTSASMTSDVSSSATTSYRSRWTTDAGKAVTHTSSSSSSQTEGSLSSSALVTGSSGITSATTLSIQTSSTGLSSSAAAASSTVALSTTLPSGDSSVSSAVPTSQAEIMAKLEALADEWSTAQPSNWQDEINELKSEMQVASSQAAAVSATLKQKQRRHLLQHKKRFGGHH